MSTSASALATLPGGLVVLMMLLGAAMALATLAVGLPIAIVKGFQLVSAVAEWSRGQARLGRRRGQQPVEPTAPWLGDGAGELG